MSRDVYVPKMANDDLPAELNQITGKIVAAACAVHSRLGPGLLESVYEVCLAHQLEKDGLKVKRQVPMPVAYDGVSLDAGFRLDLLVENQVVVEIKAVDGLLPVHKAQVITYLKLGGYRAGLLVNFNVEMIRDGVKRIVV